MELIGERLRSGSAHKSAAAVTAAYPLRGRLLGRRSAENSLRLAAACAPEGVYRA